jgi:hypothetical protein
MCTSIEKALELRVSIRVLLKSSDKGGFGEGQFPPKFVALGFVGFCWVVARKGKKNGLLNS